MSMDHLLTTFFTLLDPSQPHDYVFIPAIIMFFIVGYIVATWFFLPGGHDHVVKLMPAYSLLAAADHNVIAASPTTATTSTTSSEEVVSSGQKRRQRSNQQNQQQPPPAASKSLKIPKCHDDVKMVLIVRKDLGLSSGDQANLCTEAAVNCVINVSSCTNVNWLSWKQCWDEVGVAKIALKCPDQATFDTLKAAVTKKKLPFAVACKLPDPPVTTKKGAAGAAAAASPSAVPQPEAVLAVGPAPLDDIDDISGNLKLL